MEGANAGQKKVRAAADGDEAGQVLQACPDGLVRHHELSVFLTQERVRVRVKPAELGILDPSLLRKLELLR